MVDIYPLDIFFNRLRNERVEVDSVQQHPILRAEVGEQRHQQPPH